jgi:hypothetical protein
LDGNEFPHLENSPVGIGRIDFKHEGLEIRAILRLINETLRVGNVALKPQKSEQSEDSE